MLQTGILALLVVFPVVAFFVLDRATRFAPPAVQTRPVVRPRITIRNEIRSRVRIRQSNVLTLELAPPSSLEVSLN